MSRDKSMRMAAEMIAQLENSLKRRPLVLDLGGGYFPCSLATHVADMISYDYYSAKIRDNAFYNKDGSWGGAAPRFSKDTWVQHDICSSKPLPFPDKYFDFAVCTHILEDIVNPFRAVQELNRVSKAGYIEVPSKEIECTPGIDGILGSMYPGYNHHFWMFTLEGKTLLIEPKYSFISSSRNFHFPKRFLGKWKKDDRDIVRLFWEGSIDLRAVENPLAEDLRIRQMKYIRSKGGFTLSMLFLYIYDFLKKIRKRLKKSI